MPKQPPVSPESVTLTEFLAAFFPDPSQVHVCFFDADPNKGASRWKGRKLKGTTFVPPGSNAYFCIAELKPDAPRVLGEVANHRMIVADDVGTKVGPDKQAELLRIFGEPTAQVLTSPGNETWIWGFGDQEIPATAATSVSWLNALRAYMGREGLTDASTVDAVRYVRLPFGVNTKDKYQNPFDGSFPSVALTAWRPFAVVDVAQACERVWGEDWQSVIACDTGGFAGTNVPSALPGGYFATMNDPWVRLADMLGMNPHVLPGGRIECDCPNIHNHTQRGETGFAWLGGDLCECHHAACAHLRVPDFKRLLEDKYEAMSALGQLPPGAPARAKDFIAHCEFEAAGGLSEEDARHVASLTESAKATASRRAETDAALARACERFVYVAERGEMWDRKNCMWMKEKQVNEDAEVIALLGEYGARGKATSYAQMINAGALLRRVQSVTSKPGQAKDEFVKDINNYGQEVDCLNLYRPTSVVEDRSQQPTAFLELLNFLYPEKDKQEFLLNTMAFHLQNGDDRLPFLHLLVGSPGVGKDQLLSAYFRVEGIHNCISLPTMLFRLQFNNWAWKRHVYLCEAKLEAQDYSRLKSYIASGPSLVTINEKGQPAVPKMLAPVFWASSNDEDAVFFSGDDRRVVVLRSYARQNEDPRLDNDPNTAGTKAWFERIIAGLRAQDGALLWFLRSRNIANWHEQRAPDFGDDAKKDMLLSSMSPAEEWAASVVAPGGAFGDRLFLSTDELLDLAASEAKGSVVSQMSANGFSRALRALGWTQERRSVKGVRYRVWARDEATLAQFNTSTGKSRRGETLPEAYLTEQKAWVAQRQNRAAGQAFDRPPEKNP